MWFILGMVLGTLGIWWQDKHQCLWNGITIPFLSNFTKVALSSGTSKPSSISNMAKTNTLGPVL